MDWQDGSYEVLLVEVSLALLVGLSFACLFLKKCPATRRPEQLILAQTQAQVIMDLHWLILFDKKIMESASTCKVLTFVAYTGFVMSCIYTAAICVAASLHFDRHKYPCGNIMWQF